MLVFLKFYFRFYSEVVAHNCFWEPMMFIDYIEHEFGDVFSSIILIRRGNVDHRRQVINEYDHHVERSVPIL